MILKIQKSDFLGVMSSSLCLLHCIATPLLYTLKASSFCCSASTPLWWKLLDYFFLVISLIAVLWSIKHSFKPWIKFAFCVSWLILALVILNETYQFISFTKYAIYILAFSLIVLHVINTRYCRCQNDTCCINETNNDV